jgi:putative intracellular protease/amidase
MSKGKVLLVCSNATKIEVKGGGTGDTGHYLNETVVPILAVIKAGYDVVLATPNGTKPPLDAVSRAAEHFGGDEAAFRRAEDFFANDPSMNRVRKLRSVVEEGLQNYAGVFVPGGQAPVVDLMQDPDLGEILRHFHAQKKPTAMLCHGPIAGIAALPTARDLRAALIAGDMAKATALAKGWQYAGYKMTIFSNSEEKVIEDNILHAEMYFHVVDTLEMAGGKVITTAKDFEPHVIEDREFITGQNPRSDHLLGAKLVQALDRTVKRAA